MVESFISQSLNHRRESFFPDFQFFELRTFSFSDDISVFKTNAEIILKDLHY